MECEICKCPFPGYLLTRLEGQPGSFVCKVCYKDGIIWAARNAYLLKRSEAVNEAASRLSNGQQRDEPEGSPTAPS